MDDLSPKVQNQIAQFQQLQQQLQAVLNQKFQMDAQVKEMARTTEELKKSAEDVVIYKSIGALLIKADSKEAILKDIEVHDYDVFTRRAHTRDLQKLALMPGIWWRARSGKYPAHRVAQA